MNTYPIETELYTVSPVFTSVWALLIYAVLLALMIIIGVRYYASYKLKEDMPNYAEKRIAKYKAEVERQKEMITRLQNEKREIEIEHKHKEIANIVMMMVRKCEALRILKKELDRQKETLGNEYPSKCYNKLAEIIKQHMESEDDWYTFQTNFNCIYPTFFDKLQEACPELTPYELKVCAYLKLNLPLLDMSILLDISVRGVEMARYRIRRKLGIHFDTELMEFVAGFN